MPRIDAAHLTELTQTGPPFFEAPNLRPSAVNVNVERMRVASLSLLVLIVASPGLARADADVVAAHRTIVIRHHTAGPWIVFGLGWALILGGLLTELLSQPVGGDSCGSCPPESPTASALAGQVTGWIGVGTGAAMVIGGMAWHVAEPTGPRVVLTPIAIRNTFALTLRATF